MYILQPETSTMNELKTSDKKSYMREYMRNRYNQNPKKACNMKKAYYYKSKYNLDDEEVAKYGENLHLIVKVKKLIKEIEENCPQHLEDLRKF